MHTHDYPDSIYLRLKAAAHEFNTNYYSGKSMDITYQPVQIEILL